MKTTHQKVSKEINATPEQAWDVIGAVGGVDKWFSSIIKTCRVEGSTRICETQDGFQLFENILEVNNSAKIFRYSIPEQEMLPIENIVAALKVTSSDSGNAIIEWSGSFLSTDDNSNMASEAIKGLWGMGIDGIENHINA